MHLSNTTIFLQGEEMTAYTFDQAFRKFYPVLVLFARKLVRDKPAAEDIVTDVFCKLWQRQPRFPSQQSIKSFLYISTRNACINHLRRKAYQAGINNTIRDLSANQTEDFALNQIISCELYRQVNDQLESLPNACRRVMRMSFVQGRSNREIASKLQLSINTVRNQKARGIHLMRKRLRAVSGFGFEVLGS